MTQTCLILAVVVNTSLIQAVQVATHQEVRYQYHPKHFSILIWVLLPQLFLTAGPHGKIYIVDLLQRPHIPKLHVSVLLMLCSPTQFTLECNGRRRILITWWWFYDIMNTYRQVKCLCLHWISWLFIKKGGLLFSFSNFDNVEHLKASVSIVRSNPKTLPVVLDSPYLCLLFRQSMEVIICSSTKERKMNENPLTFQHN